MEAAFFAWVEANDIPFFAIFCATLGFSLGGAFAVKAALDAAVNIYRKIKSN